MRALGEVFAVVGDGVGVFPEAFGFGLVVSVGDFVVEGKIDVVEGAFLEDVGEFVDEDVFALIGIAF